MLTRFPQSAGLLSACLLALTTPLMAAPPQGQLVQHTYPVADLIIPLARAAGIPPSANGKRGKQHKAQATLENRLMKLIVKSAQPATWQPNGGPGTIDYYPLGMTFVVNQTQEVHQKVAKLLDDLRKPQDTEVALEVRLLTVSDAVLERIGTDFNIKTAVSEPSGTPSATPQLRSKSQADTGLQDLGLTFLNDGQVRKLMETIQGNRRANIMQSPKVTLFNGQKADVNITDTQFFLTGVDVVGSGEQATFHPKNEPATTGFHLTAQPVVSADRRFVQLYLNLDLTELASSEVPLMPAPLPVAWNKGQTAPSHLFLQQPQFARLAVEKTVAIPDGGTVVLGGFKKMVETQTAFGPPVLSDIPYLNRLFRNVSYVREPQLVFLLVTPRILVTQDDEQIDVAAVRRGYEQVRQLCPGSRFAQLAAAAENLRNPPCRLGSTEEQEVTEQCQGISRCQKVLEALLKAYEEACAEGRRDEAEKLARAALTIDPTCFRRR